MLPAMALAFVLLACIVPMPAAAAGHEEQDPFRYLEDAADPRTQQFFHEQGARARQALDRIPGREGMLARIRALSEGGTVVTHLRLASGRVFYLKREPRRASAALCVREGVAGPERVLLDPARYDQESRRAAIDWFEPSPDGRHVAFGVSAGGSEDSVLRVVAVEGARVLPLEIDRARFNAALSWHPDSRAFYYARIPEANRPPKRFAHIRLYRHVLGRETARDEIVFASGSGGAREVPETVFPSIQVPLESRFAYAVAREGVRREIAVHVALQKDLAAGRPRWHRIAGPEDEVLAIEGWRDDLYLLSKRNAPRHRILRVKGGAESLAGARPVVPQGEAVIQAFGLARDAIYLRTMVGGVDRLERVPLGLLGAKAPEYVRTPFDTAITQLVTHPRVAGALLHLQGWIEPPVVLQLEAPSGNLRRTPIQPAPVADFSEIDEVRLYAPATDGARIPVTLVYRKSTRLDGRNPTLVTAHGSYGLAPPPTFEPARLAWLERGGVFAIAHVRGGGEYGEEWHRAGRGAAKVNAIRDLIAVSDFLVSYGFTQPARLVVQGSGAGGIPVGGALVRRPELFAAAVARAPFMDLLRFELVADGPAHVPEFGSAARPEGAEALLPLSAYHQVKAGTPYPAVLLIAGLAHPRVDAWQPGKMAARLQAATASDKPVLLRVDPHGGQPAGASREADRADIYSFLLWQMGEPGFQPEAPKAEAPAKPEIPAKPEAPRPPPASAPPQPASQ